MRTHGPQITSPRQPLSPSLDLLLAIDPQQQSQGFLDGRSLYFDARYLLGISDRLVVNGDIPPHAMPLIQRIYFPIATHIQSRSGKNAARQANEKIASMTDERLQSLLSLLR